jgi:hypothetical protein
MRHAFWALLLFFSPNSHAILTAPVLEAADALNHSAISEIEFSPGATVPTPNPIEESALLLRRMCPGENGSAPTRELSLLLIAWPDAEFPPAGVHRPWREVKIAQTRGQNVEAALILAGAPRAHIEIVNMATRTPHFTRVRHGPSTERKMDVKHILESNGAAPTTPYQIGLFGEYAQHGKVLIMARCEWEPPRRTPRLLPEIRIAGILPHFRNLHPPHG